MEYLVHRYKDVQHKDLIIKLVKHRRFGGFCSGVDMFDEKLFRLTPIEASAMDPQQRILLEETQAALGNASGNLNRSVNKSTGSIPDMKSLFDLKATHGPVGNKYTPVPLDHMKFAKDKLALYVHAFCTIYHCV